jgi:predicted dithiol-disulfide oxidoreductase (DUF899 family)
MTSHPTASREEWLAARRELWRKERELTRVRDELARERRALPWVKVGKPYLFDGPGGSRTLADLFDGRSQLVVYHFMLAPGWKEGCVGCSFLADHIDAARLHLEHHDVTVAAVSRAPFAEIDAFKRRMGWRFSWVSSYGSDFNYDFQAAVTAEQWDSGAAEYNFRSQDLRPASDEQKAGLDEFASRIVGTDWATYRQEGPGMSAFAIQDGAVYHTYSAYARGLDGLWGMYQWLDRAPLGRNEDGFWWRRHDEYDAH